MVQIVWPPKSPDLTPPDSIQWGLTKHMVYYQPLPKNLSYRIANAAASDTSDTLHHICHATVGCHNETPQLIKLNVSRHNYHVMCYGVYCIGTLLYPLKAVKLLCAHHLSHMHYHYIKALFMRLHFNMSAT